MALVVKDRVKETSTTAGTGTLTLAGAVSGFRAFSDIGNGNTTYYCIVDSNSGSWEVGIGTYTSSGTTLSRDTVLSNSLGTTAKIDFASSSKDVFVTYPSSKSVNYEQTGGVVIADNSTNNALRITQTGTGNALLVEDSTNPDSSPFVIDATGNVVVGATTSQNSSYRMQSIGTNGGDFLAQRWNSVNTGGSIFRISRSRGASVGTNAVVQSGDTISTLWFEADDGTNFINAAQILAQIDGTPGTNDMPGRLVFSTTADGASSPTERMRISNTGQLTFTVADMTTTNPSAFTVNSTGKAAQTGTYVGLISTTNTDATYTGAGSVIGVYSNQGTYTVAPTASYGFYVPSSFTGATNNYGFYSSIASGTNRYNFYANGTAANYIAGGLQIGGTADSTITSGLSLATSNKIYGDFSNATLANRTAFQTSTTNSFTAMYVLPNGTNTRSYLVCTNKSDPTNASYLSVEADQFETRLNSGRNGTGNYLPVTFYAGSSEAARIDIDRNFYFDSGFGSSALVYGCRAWVNMDTTTATITVRESGNISSITDTAAGRFTLNFTNAMPDANYVISGSGGNATGTTTSARSVTRDGTWTTTACQVRNLASSTTQDDSYIGILILR